MDVETQKEVVSTDSPSSPVTGKEGVPSDVIASDHDEENSGSMKAREEEEEKEEEEEAVSEPGEDVGHELMVDDINTSEDLKVNEVNEQPTSHEESVVSEINSRDGDRSPRLHLEAPGRQSSPTQQTQEAEGGEPTAGGPSHEEYTLLLQELCEDGDKARQRCSLLQTRLAEVFSKRAGEDGQPDRRTAASEQLQQQYEEHGYILADLKQQLTADSESAQQQAEELRLKSQEMLDQVEHEWRAFVAQKQDVAVTVLSQRLGKQAAQAKVEAVLATEQHLQQELSKQRLKHIKLKIQIGRLEAELRGGEERARDPLTLQFEQLQLAKMERKFQTQKLNEECLKMEKKISSGLELLSNSKEKLFWSQMEVQAKQEQLGKVEATVARKRDLLTRTKQARNGLQMDNQRLKGHRGLLGNRVLLWDFENTVDASDHLEKQLEDLKRRYADTAFRLSCGLMNEQTNECHE